MNLKKILSNGVKAVVTLLFIFFIVRTVNIGAVTAALREARPPLVLAGYALYILLTFLLALRWMVLARAELKGQPVTFMRFWKLTMTGLFFNLFLPTGAGGDAAKIYYLVRDGDRKLTVGTSVLADRFVGALTVLFMGTAAVLFAPGIPPVVVRGITGIFVLLCGIVCLLGSKRVAGYLGGIERRPVLHGVVRSIIRFCLAFHGYVSRKSVFTVAAVISILLQIVSIMVQYVFTMALFGGSSPVPVHIYFIYVPLIWLANLIPSIGGLGVREFSYVFFFAAWIGKEKAFALSLLGLTGILVQGIFGGIIFLTLKLLPAKESPPASGPSSS